MHIYRNCITFAYIAHLCEMQIENILQMLIKSNAFEAKRVSLYLKSRKRMFHIILKSTSKRNNV